MAINFPNAPVDGEVYVSGTTSFRYDATQDAWRKLPASNVIISDTAPTSGLQPGYLWWNSNNGRLSVYYDDSDSQQWVNVAPSSGAGGTFVNDGAQVFYDGSLNVGIGTATPTARLDIDSTDSIRVPRGTSGERPVTPLDGMLRYNTSIPQFEGYSSTSWIALGIPSGGIIMWSGSIATIPVGWALCDGTNGTPDLRDRFVVGAGTTYAPGNTGGANTVALSTAELPSHTHSDGTLAAASAGAHTHSFSATTSSAGSHAHGHTFSIGNDSMSGFADLRRRDGGGSLFGSTSGVLSASTSPNSQNRLGAAGGSGSMDRLNISHTHSHSLSGGISSAGAHTHTISGTTGSAGAHTHDVTGATGATGSGTAHENRPPYYALAYIMKL